VTRILIHGAGKMARCILAQISEFPGCDIIGLVSRTQPEDLDARWLGPLQNFEGSADVLIDFTLPGGTCLAAQWCGRNNVALLTGTTGLSDGDIKVLRKAALNVPVLWAPNLSFGIALMSSLLRQSATALGNPVEISINDRHHQHKVDAPSGTALALAEVIRSAGTGVEPVFTNQREGEVIGEHTVSFVMPDEEITISHKALRREVFANGALRAGEWLVGQAPGFYSTSDWLGLD